MGFRPIRESNVIRKSNEDSTSNNLEILSKKTRSILNKLTPQKFETLLDQFSNLKIESDEEMKECTQLIFDKAVEEPSFCILYAKMCDVIRKAAKNDARKDKVFQRVLIQIVQKEFDKTRNS